MQTLLRRLGNVRIPRRVGLAAMTFAAILPVGLSAVGNADGAKTAAFVGVPVVLLAAVAWRGGKPPRGTKACLRRVIHQKQAGIALCFALLASMLWSDWPREAAVFVSVTLNQKALEAAACQARKIVVSRPDLTGWTGWSNCETDCGLFYPYQFWSMPNQYRIGLISTTRADINQYGDVSLYTEQTSRDGFVTQRCVYTDRGPGHGEHFGP